MKTLTKRYKIKAAKSSVWDALVNPLTIAKWGAAPAKMSEKKGEDFELWGGDIWGKNLEIVKTSLLVQDWFSGKEWKKPSKVSFNLKSIDESTTELKLEHSEIPEEDFEDISSGWDEYYLGPIKKLLES